MAKFFIDRPVFAWVIALFILIGGALSITLLPVALVFVFLQRFITTGIANTGMK